MFAHELQRYPQSISTMTQSLRPYLILALCACSLNAFGARPEVLEDLPGFDRPVSAAFGLDGKTLFVANRSRGEVGAKRGAGTITKFSVGEGLEFKLASKRFVVGLTAPADIDFLPVSLGDIAPAGTLIVVSGTPLIETEDGRITKDASDDFIGLSLIDPVTGKILKKADMGPASNLKLKGEFPLVSPNSIAFDKSGNLYVADTGIGGNLFRNRVKTQPVIYRIERSGLVDLFSGTAPNAVQVMKISSIPGDLSYQAEDDAVYFVANHLQGATRGAVFKVSSQDFQSVLKIQTVVRDMTALASMRLTPRGRALLATNSGELHVPKNRKSSRLIRFRPEMTFSSPGKFGLLPEEGGSFILAVPEETGDAGAGKGQRVRIVRLPSNY